MSNVLKQTGYRKVDGAIRVQSHYVSKRAVQNAEADEKPTKEMPVPQDEAKQVLQQAKRQADELIKQASHEAERLQAEAKAAIEAWWNEQREQDSRYKEEFRQQAYDAGYMQGYDNGIAEAQQEVTDKLNKAQQIVETAYVAKEQIISEAEPFLVQLSLAIAEKVIARQVELDHTVIVDMVSRALDHCHDTGVVTVLIKPEYFPLLQEARDELKQYLNDAMELKIFPDRTLESDGCIVRSQRGTIDARVDVQLDQIKKVLTEVAKEGEQLLDARGYEVHREAETTESDSR